MNPVRYRFIEAKVARTEAFKERLLPLLMLEDAEEPWTSARLLALAAQPDLDPFVRDALDHLLRYELPLLQEEERLEALGLDHERFREAMVQFEEAFWEARFAEEGEGETPSVGRYLCAEHELLEPTVHRVVAHNPVWEAESVVAASGGDPQCPICRVAVSRILRDVLHQAKAEGRLP
jgi:hypothetical protein